MKRVCSVSHEPKGAKSTTTIERTSIISRSPPQALVPDEINLTPSLHRDVTLHLTKVTRMILTRADNPHAHTHTHTTLLLATCEPTHAANSHLSHSAGRFFIRFF